MASLDFISCQGCRGECTGASSILRGCGAQAHLWQSLPPWSYRLRLLLGHHRPHHAHCCGCRPASWCDCRCPFLLPHVPPPLPHIASIIQCSNLLRAPWLHSLTAVCRTADCDLPAKQVTFSADSSIRTRHLKMRISTESAGLALHSQGPQSRHPASFIMHLLPGL